MRQAERRRFHRLRIGCKITVHSGKHDMVLTSCTENIAEGGIRVYLKNNLDIGTITELELFLSEARPLHCKGRVIWSMALQSGDPEHRFFDIGIEFLDLTHADKEAINKLLDNLLVRAKK